VPDINVKRLAARYRQVRNLSQCAREFSIGRRRCKALLEREGVLEQAGQEAAVDVGAVLHAYDRLGSVTVVARLLDVTGDEVREILDRHQVVRVPHGELPSFTGKGIARFTTAAGPVAQNPLAVTISRRPVAEPPGRRDAEPGSRPA
jgi:hypothetical protein